MAITNAQQYKQLVNPPLDGKRPGYRGDAAARSTGAKQSGRADPGAMSDPGEGRDSQGRSAPTEGMGASEGPSGRDDVVTADTLRRNQLALDAAEYKRGQEALDNLKVSSANFPTFFPGSTFLNIGLGATTKFRQKMLDKNVDYFKNLSGIENKGYPKTAEGYKEYMSDRLAGKIDAAGNPLNTGDDRGGGDGMSDYERRLLELEKQNAALKEQAAAPTTTQNPFAYRFFADGGSTGGIMDADIVGGMMDGNMDEMGRQMYGLGKLVKKATRAVKKVAKSPIGKAALLYGLGAVGGSFGNTGKLFSKGMFSPGNISRGLFGITAKGQALRGFPELAAKKGLFGQLGLTGGYGGLMPTLKGGLALASLAPLVFQGDEEEENFDPYRGPDIDIDKIRSDPYGAMGGAYRFAADGGIMRSNYQEGGDAEPVAKKTMPLIDMDGKEKDYRETGGFVDMGRMERADDVPARLSKNEFVFTADAVRNAGEGDIDKGAEVMYNMMKNLEAGGEVSEESQGLEGARKMFQTSQRLGEVI